jgi:cell division transport system ATP-binding protein
VIRLSNIGLAYEQGPDILSDVNFHLRPGSFHFLTGPSGAGKTSLLRLLFMSRHPTRGQIQLFNQDVSRISTSKRAQLRRRIGIVFQDFRLLDHLTTWENVALPLRVAIARAVIGKPELLLADEPTGNVDPQMARRLLRLFIELNRLGTSVLIATHDHQLMRQFKAPRLELHDGHVRIV